MNLKYKPKVEKFKMNSSNTNSLTVSPSECLAILNQSLNYAFHGITVVGEISSFKVSKQYVFFDIKDEGSALNCFSTVYQLAQFETVGSQLKDGTAVEAMLSPKVLDSGRLSFTVMKLKVVGEGQIKNQLDELKLKYQKLGFFDPARKRPLPNLPSQIAVISSADAAGWKDFLHILNLNWPSVKINFYNVNVQGQDAPTQIVRAISLANQNSANQMITIIRGGGSADDLSTFNHQAVIEQIFGSNLPILLGVGHKVDVTLSELVADRAAATPTDAANIIFPKYADFMEELKAKLNSARLATAHQREGLIVKLKDSLTSAKHKLFTDLNLMNSYLNLARQKIESADINNLFDKGFLSLASENFKSLKAKKLKTGQVIKLSGKNVTIKAELKEVNYER